MKLLPIFLSILSIILFLNCMPPDPGWDKDKPIVPIPDIDLGLKYDIDPYVVKDKSFNLSLIANPSGGKISVFDFTFTYDPVFINLNPNTGDQGIIAGTDSIIVTVDSSLPGFIRVKGTYKTTAVSGNAIKLFTINWQALASGQTNILINVNQLLSDKGIPFKTVKSWIHPLVIGEPAYFLLAGNVVDSIGGSAVAGAQVSLEGTGYMSITDTNGHFSFDAVIIGVYDIVVRKEKWAGSRLQQVYVTQDQTAVEIIQPNYNYDDIGLAVTPPAIKISGIERNHEYSGLVPVEVAVIAGSYPVVATETHYSIYLRSGTTPLIYYDIANSTTDQLSCLWNTTFLPVGEVYLKAVAYDINNNRSELNIPIILTADLGKIPSVAPTDDDFSIIANTFGHTLNILRSSQPDTTVIVEFMMARYYNGMVIYRSDTKDGPFTLIGQSSDTNGSYKFNDYSAALEPGTTVFYKLAYFNQYGQGPTTDAISVRILPKYHLTLLSPANYSAVPSTSVTLNWACDATMDAQRTDWITVNNVLDATVITYSFVINQTQYALSDLVDNNQYEWNVRSVYEYINPTKNQTANVVSRSFPYGRGADDLSGNGSFNFTIIKQ